MSSRQRRSRAALAAVLGVLCAAMWAVTGSTVWFLAAAGAVAALVVIRLPARLQYTAVGAFFVLCLVMWAAASRTSGLFGMALSVAGLLAVGASTSRATAGGPVDRLTPWVAFDAATGVHVDTSGNGWLSRVVNPDALAEVLAELALSATQGVDGAAPTENHRDAHVVVVAQPDPTAEPLCVVSAKLRPRRWLVWFGWARGLVRQILQSANPTGVVANQSLARTLGLADFADDTRLLSAAFARVGARPLTEDEVAVAHAWWSPRPWDDVQIVAHPDHLHLFGSPNDRAVVQQLVSAGSADWDDCETWPGGLTSHRSLTFGAVVDFGGPRQDGESGWIRQMLSQGVEAVSIRLRSSPSALTADQLLELRDRPAADDSQGQLSRAEIRSRRHAQLVDLATEHPDLNYVSAIAALDAEASAPETDSWTYERGSGPTLAWARVSQAAGISVRPLPYRQLRALNESQVGTASNVAPQQHQVPAERISGALAKGQPS